MNSDDKLECLRLAIESFKSEFATSAETTERAQQFYNWVYEHEKPNSLIFEKISKERE